VSVPFADPVNTKVVMVVLPVPTVQPGITKMVTVVLSVPLAAPANTKVGMVVLPVPIADPVNTGPLTVVLLVTAVQPGITKATMAVHRAAHGQRVLLDDINPKTHRAITIAYATCGRPVVRERIKRQHLPSQPIVVAAIARMGSTKPMVHLRDLVVPFVRPGMRLLPCPPVVWHATEASTKHKTTHFPSPVLRIPPVPPVAMEVHPPLPSTERVPIVNRPNFKHPILLLAHRAPHGPPAELDKKVPRLPPPPTVCVPIADPANTRHKILSPVRLAQLGPNVLPVKKAPYHRCPSIVFVPIAATGNTKRPTDSQGLRVLLGPPVPLVKKEQYLV